MPGLRMAKAPKEHIDRLRTWMQFTDEISKIDLDNQREWESFTEDWKHEEDFIKIIKHCTDEYDCFSSEYYFDYFHSNISYIYSRIILGFEILLDNCCDQKLDYLDFNKDISQGLNLLEKKRKINNKKQREYRKKIKLQKNEINKKLD